MWKNDITVVSLFAICRCFIQEACHRFRKKEINFLAQQTICLRTLNEQTLMRKSLCFYWRKFQSPLHSLSCLNEIFLVASWPSTRKRKWLQNNVGNKVHWWWNTDENIWNTAMHPIFWRWITSKIYFFLSSAHPPLHHSIPYEFSHPCCPSQRIFPPPAAQTLVPFSGNNWSVGWYFCPASLYYLLDVLGSGTLAPLSIRIWRSLHHGLCIVFSVFDDDDGHYRGHTSRHVVGAEVKKNCNFEAHIYHCSYHLDFISCLFVMHFTWWLYNFFAPSHNYTTLLGYFTRTICKDFSHSQISSGSGRRSCSTTTEATSDQDRISAYNINTKLIR